MIYVYIFCDQKGYVCENKTHTHLVELLLKLLVGIIDAKLFKAVDVKCFKPGKEKKKSLKLKKNKHVWSSRKRKHKTTTLAVKTNP